MSTLRQQRPEADNRAMNSRKTKADQSEATRGALIAVGRELFATRGYANTFTDEVADRAGVTRGALYHHFRRKEDLFRAVYGDVEQELMEKITARIVGLDAWERLRVGVEAFLEFSFDPAVQRITVLDAPSVLGWDAWREIDSKYGYGWLLRASLQAAMEAGAIEIQPVEPLAAFIFGGLMEGAMLIARSDDQEATRRQVAKAVERLMQRQGSADEKSGAEPQ
jgi:AcrR family transcriptional regulator